jgi:predicted solute-binding protein
MRPSDLSKQFATDRTLRVGSVPYLNVQPLLRALRDTFYSPGPWQEAYPGGLSISTAVPRQLARLDRAGAFDVAIVPVFEHLSHPGGHLLPGTCIGARGPVESVILFAPVPINQVTRIELDPASLTSVHLIRVLMDWRGQAIEWTERPRAIFPAAPLHGTTARLIIGDDALRLRGTQPTEWDLAEAWIEGTGLPFVFAAWQTRLADCAAPDSPVAQLFARLRDSLPRSIEEAARLDGPAFGFRINDALSYLSRAIHYDFGADEQAAIDRFASECRRLGLLPASESRNPAAEWQPAPACP